MNRSRWILFTAAILLAGCLISLDAYRHYHDAGGRTRDALLSGMPTDASAVLFVDSTDLRRSLFSAQLYNWIPKSPADAEYTQFLRATRFDYERDLDRVAIAVIKDRNESQLFAIAEGRFDREWIGPQEKKMMG